MRSDIDWREGPDGREHLFAIMLDRFGTRRASLPNGSLALYQSRGYDGDGLNEQRLRQSLSFELTFNETVSLEDAVDVASDLQDLVTVGTHRVAAFEYLHLYNPDIFTERPNGINDPVATRLLLPWHAKPDTSKRGPIPYDMAFTFEELGGMDGVAQWLAVAERYRSMLGRVMATKYVRMFVQDRFLHRIVALEGLHRTLSGTTEATLLTRLRSLCDLAGDPISGLLPDVAAWCRKAKAERNHLAHFYGRPIHQDGSDVYKSSEVAYWLFVVCLLRLAKAPDPVFQHISRNPDLNWLKAHLANQGY
jgi:hypothetical protein